ncbi:FAD-dependent tricarballylate dehydrogenase TcuA [Roseospira visakhapatnamensis]|uniref:Tricarballylate dehydrogenase n=1 Tax=Roseospira visakhapatnamensis TaxID=390880 RepID=A0A7W6WAN4_9PROT|nr:FAD-dependent tricarballylate dehydrogenase TcuA [Roseospira visakhapatnamensis]MBB4267139.1 tricarballylate dehydrogenase [Roseospira visakhapatnamensis]
MTADGPPEVLVAGGGLAALCAAIVARRAGASVWLLDQAPEALRGGNTRHARNMRVAHDGPSPLVADAYPEAEFRTDLRRVGGDTLDEALAARLVADSVDLPAWLAAQGVAFQPRAGGMLPYSRRTVFLLGGGTAMVNALVRTAARLGVVVRHGVTVADVDPGGGVTITRDGATRRIATGAVVVATGGFQANRGWLRETFGPAADGFVNRGTPHADGRLLRALLDQGAMPVGDAARGHLVAVDARSPADDGGIVTRAEGMTDGLVLDRDGRPLVDPAAERGSPRYANWGRLVAEAPGQIAHVILDAAGLARLGPRVYPPVRTLDTLALAACLGLDAGRLAGTLACHGPGGGPPWFTLSLRPGLTFTGLGVRVDDRARVLDGRGRPWPGVFAAGMIMAPALLGGRYLSGTALTVSAVFGRRAGEEAARHALDL